MNPFAGALNYSAEGTADQRHRRELAAPQSAALRRALVDAALCCLQPLADATEQQLGAGGGSGGSGGNSQGSRAGSSGGGGESDGEASEASRTVAALCMLCNSLGAEVMQQAFDEAAPAPGSLLDGMKAGARIAQALPVEPPPEVPAKMLMFCHLAAARFMGMTAEALTRQPHIAAVWQRRNEEYLRAAESEDEDEESEQPAAAGAGLSAAEVAAEAEADEAARQALRVLPRLMAVLPGLTVANPGDIVVTCLIGHYIPVVQLPHLQSSFGGADHVAEWAAAAEVALRLLPPLASHDAHAVEQRTAGEYQRTCGGDPLTAAEHVAGHLVSHIWQWGADRLVEWATRFAQEAQQLDGSSSDAGSEQQHGQASSSGSEAGDGGSAQRGSPESDPSSHPPAELVQQLFQLHSTACRLAACWDAQAAPLLPWQIQLWPKLALGCTTVLDALHDLSRSSDDPQRCGGSCLGLVVGQHALVPQSCCLGPCHVPDSHQLQH